MDAHDNMAPPRPVPLATALLPYEVAIRDDHVAPLGHWPGRRHCPRTLPSKVMYDMVAPPELIYEDGTPAKAAGAGLHGRQAASAFSADAPRIMQRRRPS